MKKKMHRGKLIGIIGLIVIVLFYFDFKYFQKVHYFNSLTDALFVAIVSISAIWTAYYLLFFQLFKDRYPLKMVSKDITNQMNNLFVLVSYSLILGVTSKSVSFGICLPIGFSFITIIVIVKIFKFVSESNKSLMSSTHIDKYCEELKAAIGSIDTKKFEIELKNIRLIFDESIIKEEFLITQNIIKNMGEFFRSYLSNSISMITSGRSEKEIDQCFENIIEFNIRQIVACKKVNSELVIGYVVDENFENIKILVKTNQYEWFKKYLHEINQCLFNLQRDGSEETSRQIVIIHHSVARKLIQDNKQEWLEYLIDEIIGLTHGLQFIKENSNLKICAELIYDALDYSLKKENDGAYRYLLDVLKEFTGIVNRVSNGFSDVKVYYGMIFSKLKSREKSKDFIDLIFDEEYSMNENQDWLEFKFYCIYELKESIFRGCTNEKHIQTIIDYIDQNNNYQRFVLLPHFHKEIKEKVNNASEMDDICQSFKKIFDMCIMKDNISTYSVFLKELNYCFKETTQKDKLAQEKLIKVYRSLIYKTSYLVNKQLLEITFERLRICLKELDGRKAISLNCGTIIIENLAMVSGSTIHENKAVTNLVIDLLFDFIEEGKEFYFVASSYDTKKYLCRTLFNIGTNCIENNYEEGLRLVSNALGWFAIYSIKQSNGDLTKYILQRATELYEIAGKMEISKKTMTFLLTLFTTIGTYCCKDATLKLHRNQILDSIKNSDIQSVETAISLRTSENDMWNDLYENRTDELTKRFLDDFLKSKSNDNGGKKNSKR